MGVHDAEPMTAAGIPKAHRSLLALGRSRILSPVHVRSVLPLAALSLAACANAPGLEAPDAVASQRAAVLFVERQQSDAPSASAHVGARFVQYTGIDTAALPDLIGFPRTTDGQTGCAVRSENGVDAASGHAEARLLDVGAIDVRAGERSLHLEPRRFPDLWDVVSGVIYGTDSDWRPGTWHFTARGNAQSRVAAFELDARAPDDLTNVVVADQPLVAGATIAVSARAFGVRWSRGDTNDSVRVVFESVTSTAGTSSISCTARDDGALDVDATWADRIADALRDGGRITAHRVRVHAITLPSMDAARVVFDLSLGATARVE